MLTSISAKTLGERVRQVRRRRGMTQQDLAGDDYSKSYISAIEQGKTRPSLEALQRICARLETPPGVLLDPKASGFMPFDPEAMPRRIRRKRGVRAGQPFSTNDPAYIDLKLAEAEQLIYTGHPAQALEIVRDYLPDDNGASKASRPLDLTQLQRGYYLAAQATVRLGASSESLGYLSKSMAMAQRQNDAELIEKIRNALGVAYYQANQPLSALEQHNLCMDAINMGVVTNPNFKLAVYSNLANDYWALHDNSRAMDTYKEALKLLPEVNSLERQASIFWESATKQSEQGYYKAANEGAERAISLYEALDNIRLVTRMESRYGDILLDMGKFDEAESYLTRSLELADALNSDYDKATVLTNLARVSMKRNNLAQASERVDQAIGMSREAARTGAGATGSVSKDKDKGEEGKATPQSKAKTNLVLAKALALAGEVATANHEADEADQHFNEAARIVEASENGAVASDIYQRYAQALANRGQHEQAAKFYERAYRAVTRRS